MCIHGEKLREAIIDVVKKGVRSESAYLFRRGSEIDWGLLQTYYNSDLAMRLRYDVESASGFQRIEKELKSLPSVIKLEPDVQMLLENLRLKFAPRDLPLPDFSPQKRVLA